MENLNKFGSTEYLKEDLRQKELIADLVKEAFVERIKSDNYDTLDFSLEKLCSAVSFVSESVNYSAKLLDEAEAREGLHGGELV